MYILYSLHLKLIVKCMFKKLIFSFLFAIVLTNCSRTGTIILSEKNETSIYGKKLVVINRKAPSFYLIYGNPPAETQTYNTYSGGYGSGYGIGKNAASASFDATARINFYFSEENEKKGNKIIADNNVKDPAELIRKTVVEDFKNKYNPKAINYGEFYIDRNYGDPYYNDVPKLSKYYENSDLILDIRTVMWSASDSKAQNPAKYQVSYQAELRLIDVKGKKVVARGSCANLMPNNSSIMPATYNDLTKNRAEILKTKLNNEANACIAKLESEILNLK